MVDRADVRRSFGAWRGASWNNNHQDNLRSSNRNDNDGSNRNNNGFRLLTGRNIGPKSPSRIDHELVAGWDEFVEQAMEEEKAERLAGAVEGLRLSREIEDAIILNAASQEIGKADAPQSPPSFASPALTAKASAYAEATTNNFLDQSDTDYPSRMVKLKERKDSHVGDTARIDLGNSVYLDLVWIPPGPFMMGSLENEPGRYGDEGPQHPVTISKGFWMGKTEVTQKQYQEVMGTNPSHFMNAGPDATNFAGKLQARLRGNLQGKKAGLPTEAEWEYACRAGATTPFHTGRCLDASQANYDGNYPLEGCSKGTYRKTTIKVGSFPANDWGLHDMHGNVWEWCQDGKRTYRQAAVTDPGINDTSGSSSRVLRGGSWVNDTRYCRSAYRSNNDPGYQRNVIGFRVVVR